MATAKKLPSGSWRVQIYSHTESTLLPDGTSKNKRIYKSFTSDDPSPKGKRQVEKEAALWAANKELDSKSYNKTIGDMINDYCAAKSNVLSPTTINGYKSIKENMMKSISELKADRVGNDIIQQWINEISIDKSPKTVRNAHGLLVAAYDLYYPERRIRIKLPQKIKKTTYTPSDEDIKILMDHFKCDNEMLKAVCLAAFGTLRRSEICALTADDVHGCTIAVNKAMVRVSRGEWTIKTTKTVSSTREIIMPQFVIDMLPKSGKLVEVGAPDNISNRFARAIKKLKLGEIRFHDLRHYAASIMHALNVPDQYIMQRGGWASDKTLKQVYRGTINDYEQKYVDVTIKHFESMQHEMQHKNKKA